MFIIEYVQYSVNGKPNDMKLAPLPSGDTDEMATRAALPSNLGQRERNKLDKLIRIKEAARELFLAKGFDDATIREIALRAGVGLGTVFVYAENKRDLLFLIVNDQLETIERDAEAVFDRSASFIKNLLGVFEVHYRFFLRQPALSRMVLKEMTFYDSGAQANRFQRTRERLIGLVCRTVSHALSRNTIQSPESPKFIGLVIFSIYYLQLRLWVSTDNPNLRDGLESLERALKLFASGLMPRSDAERKPTSTTKRIRRPKNQ